MTRNRKYSDCCNKPAYHHEVFKQLWKCSQCWKLCKVHNHIVDADKMPVDSLSDEKALDGYQEELARIFNRTDDKEELYKQVLELLRKIK